jgi:hypothetical protein
VAFLGEGVTGSQSGRRAGDVALSDEAAGGGMPRPFAGCGAGAAEGCSKPAQRVAKTCRWKRRDFQIGRRARQLRSLLRSHSPANRWPMSDPEDKLAPADPDELTAALAFALRFSGRKRAHDADAFMAEIVAKRLVEHLDLFAVQSSRSIGREVSAGNQPSRPHGPFLLRCLGGPRRRGAGGPRGSWPSDYSPGE